MPHAGIDADAQVGGECLVVTLLFVLVVVI